MKTFKQFLFEREELGAAEQTTKPDPNLVDPKEPLKTRQQFSSDEEYKNYLNDRSGKLSHTQQVHDSDDKALGTAIAVGNTVRSGVEGTMSVLPGGSQAVAATRAASGAINYAAGNKDAAAEDAVYGVAALVPGGATPLGKAAIGAAKETAAGVAGNHSASEVATRAVTGAVKGVLPGIPKEAGAAAAGAFSVAKGAVAKQLVNTATTTINNIPDVNKPRV